MAVEDFSSNTDIIQLGQGLLPSPLPSFLSWLDTRNSERNIWTFFNINVQILTLFIEIETVLIFFCFLSNHRAAFPCSAARFLLQVS